jgi:hypothetical protein
LLARDLPSNPTRNFFQVIVPVRWELFFIKYKVTRIRAGPGHLLVKVREKREKILWVALGDSEALGYATILKWKEERERERKKKRDFVIDTETK